MLVLQQDCVSQGTEGHPLKCYHQRQQPYAPVSGGWGGGLDRNLTSVGTLLCSVGIPPFRNIWHEKVYVFDTILDKGDHWINEIKHRLIENTQNETWIHREKDIERQREGEKERQKYKCNEKE